MHVSRKADYAVRALSYLAGRTGDELVLIAEIAGAMSVPQPFLSKIMRELVDAAIVDSQPGRGGGYRLARPPGEVTFRQIIEAVEGPLHMVPCQEDGAPCEMSAGCTQVPVWDGIRRRMLEVLAEYTLDAVRPQPDVGLRLVQVGPPAP